MEGKIKLCHKKSASFSGKTIQMNDKAESKDSKIESLKQMSIDLDKSTKVKEANVDAVDESSNQVDPSVVEKKVSAGVDVYIPNTERTPGDGMDNKIGKNVFNSSINLNNNVVTTVNKEESSTEDSNVAAVTAEIDVLDKTVDIDTTETDRTKTCAASPLDQEKQNEILCATQSSVHETIFPIMRNDLSNGEQKVKKDLEVQAEPISLHLSTMDVSKEAVKCTLAKHLNNFKVAKSEPSNLHVMGRESSFYGQVSPNISRPESVTSVDNSLSGQEIADVEPNEGVLDIDNAMDMMQVRDSQQTLYEPFNSRLSWPVGFGNKLTSMWSDATLEKVFSYVRFCQK